MGIVHNFQEYTTMDDVARNLPQIYAYLDKHQATHKSNIIDVEGKIVKQPIAILIHSEEIHSFWLLIWLKDLI